jgi:hypothetical protein
VGIHNHVDLGRHIVGVTLAHRCEAQSALATDVRPQLACQRRLPQILRAVDIERIRLKVGRLGAFRILSAQKDFTYPMMNQATATDTLVALVRWIVKELDATSGTMPATATPFS